MSLVIVSRHDIENSSIFAVSNTHGIRVELNCIGASVLRVETPDRTGTLQNIALSFDSASACLASKSCAGATIGPVAGRLRDGLLHLPDRTYSLTRNDGAHTLHGGIHGLSQTCWSVAAQGENFVSFRCRLPDGLDGFPGNRDICVRYTLDDYDCLTIDYTATTDRQTFLNLTNHTYWNLTGNFSTDAYSHLLEISANTVFYNDASHLPLDIHPVQDTVFDFTTVRTLQQAILADELHPQLANAHGYNNTYLLDSTAAFAARLSDPVSGRRVTLRTDYPALVFYSGGYLPTAGSALALEAQYPPDTCQPVLMPGQIYRHTISFLFDLIT